MLASLEQSAAPGALRWLRARGLLNLARLLLVSFAAGPVLYGCPPTPPIPDREVANDVGVELMALGGHGNHVKGVTLIPWEKPRYAVTEDGQDVRAWSIREDGSWSLERIWKGVSTLHIFENLKRAGYVLVELPESSSLVRAGRWGEQLLGPEQGLPQRIDDLWTLSSEDTGAIWHAIAVQDGGDFDEDGLEKEWYLFSSEDETTWAPLRLEGAPRDIAGFIRLGLNQFAVQEHGDSNGNGHESEWLLYQRTPGGWSSLVLEGAASPLLGLQASEGGAYLSIETAERNAKGTPLRAWFLRDPKGAWAPLLSVIPAAPPRIARINAHGDEHFLEIQEEADADGDKRLFSSSYFLKGKDGRWTPLQGVLPGAPRRIQDVRVPISNQCIAVRGTIEGTGAQAHDLLAGPYWQVYLKNAREEWISIDQVIPSAPKRIWEVASFGEGRGLGFQDAADSNGNGQRYEWSWFLLREDGAWRDLRESLPPLEGHVINVTSPDVDRSMAIQEEHSGTASGPLSRWRWFLKQRGAWRELAEAIPQAPSRVKAVDLYGNGLVRVRDEEDVLHRFLPNNDGFTDLMPIIEIPHPAAVSSASLSRVEKVDVVQRGKVLRLEAPKGDQKDLYLALSGGQWVAARELLQGAQPDVHLHDVGAGAALAVVRPGQSHYDQFLVEGAGGTWAPLEQVLPGKPKRIRNLYRFLGNKGLALQEEGDQDGDGRHDQWQYWLRKPDGQWSNLLTEVAGLPRQPLAVYSLGETDGLAFQEDRDADGDGQPFEWTYLLLDATGKWRGVRELLPDAPRGIWQTSLFADETVIGVQEEGDSNGDGQAHSWFYYLRDPAGKFQKLQTLIPAASVGVSALRSFWGKTGLALRLRQADTTTPGPWKFFQQQQDGRWSPLLLPETAETVLDIRGDETLGVLALQVAKDSLALERTWLLFERTPEGSMVPLLPLLEAAPSPVAEVHLPRAGGMLALSAPRDKAGPLWHWYARGADGRWSAQGTTRSTAWIGRGWNKRVDGAIEFPGAEHYLDGAVSKGVPEPRLWLHRDSTLPAAEDTLYAPKLVPEPVEILATGSTGVLLIYTFEQRKLVAGFSHGTVEVETRRVRLPGGQEEAVPFIVNRFSDGTSRLHRMSNPAQWINVLGEPGRGRIFFDDRGFFYSEASEITGSMAFRNVNEVYTFDQLSAYLFRPDKLEERLGFPEGSFFTLTERDRANILRARELARNGAVRISSLRPPLLQIGAVAREVNSNQLTIPYVLNPGRDQRLTVSMRVVGAGGARSDGDAEPEAAESKDGKLIGQRRVSLLEGMNTIEVTVTDGLSLSDTERINVRYTPETSRPHDLWVAIIAAAAPPGFAELKYIREDAEAVYRSFAAQRGRAYGNVHISQWCTNPAPVEGETAACAGPAENKRLRSEVPAFFSRMKDGDYAVLYLTGHGLRRDNRYFFVTSDADKGTPGTMLGWDELRAMVDPANRLGRKIIIIDTCHAGAAVGGLDERQRLVQEVADLDGIYVIAASAADAKAFELPQLGNGIFTYALKHALSGEADESPQDGEVKFQELVLHLAERVRRLSWKYGVPQEPFFPMISREQDYLVAKTGSSPLINLHVIHWENGTRKLNPPASVSRWQEWLATGIPGVRFGKSDEASFHLEIQEKEDGSFSVTLSSSQGDSLLELSSEHREELVKSLAAVLLK